MLENSNNILQFVSLIKNNPNPQTIVMNELQRRAQNNPVLGNIATLVQNGDTQGVETIVRNIAKERGIDFDKEFNSFKQMFRL